MELCGRSKSAALCRRMLPSRSRATRANPVHLLIRPRAGDFVFDDLECEVMRRDIVACKTLGCAGDVLGALDPDGNIDVAHCRPLGRVLP